uniref:Solute carrier family 7 member 4 n=1 Tax=Nomascus leucogenys TaxID=61853 RepID=G1R9A8_NOMLE
MAWGLPSIASLARLCQKLNRLKPLEDSTMYRLLWPYLSTLDLTLLGVGGMMGLGLYVLTGAAAKEVAGPAVLLSFGVAAVASLLAALCYAEFGAHVPLTGSAYLFTYVSMGELWAFLIGWNVLLEYIISGAAVARAWSGYLDSMFSHCIQSFTETHMGSWQVPLLGHHLDFLAAGIILLSSAFVSRGARVSVWLSHTFSAITLIGILFIVILGFILAQPHNWSAEEGGFAPFGFSGVVAGTAYCFYAFMGFDIIAASSEEAQNPQRSVPLAIAISHAIAAGAYILVSTVLTLMVPWHSLDPYSGIADAFYQRGCRWAGFIVAAGSICAMNSVLLNLLFSLPRIVYAMTANGLFFQVFAHVHPRTQVPVAGTLVFGLLMAFLALLLDLESLVQLLSLGTLLAYTFMATSIIVLRFQKSSPPSCPGPASPGPLTKQHSSFSDHLQLAGTAHTSVPEPGELKPALRPYLGFLDGYSPGAVVTWALGVMLASAITIGCVLVFGNSTLQLPQWGYILLLLLTQQYREDLFQIPMVPLIPTLSIVLNICFMLILSYLTWVCFSIWLLMGLAVYFGYGIRHSKENQRELPGPNSTHEVVFPRGSLEETVQAVQPPSQAPAQDPDPME